MRITSDIISYSHRLEERCFRLFNENETGLRFSVVSENVFSMEIDGLHLRDIGSEDAIYHSHMLASSFLVALNIATVGFFTWRHQPSFHPVYKIQGADEAESKHIALFQERKLNFEAIRELTELDVEHTLIIFSSLLQEKDEHSRIDYLKGTSKNATKYPGAITLIHRKHPSVIFPRFFSA